MKTIFIFRVVAALLLTVMTVCRVAAQQPAIFIKAHSRIADIRDGAYLQKGIWHITPEVKPDIYFADRSKQQKTVTFYTDRDSISFQVKPGVTYSFGIITDDKDTAYTQIRSTETKTLAVTRICPDCSLKPDTLPFIFTFNNQIIIKGKINGSADLDLLFDVGANSCGIFPSGLKKSKGANVNFDGNVNVIGMGGSSNVPTSSLNALRLGTMEWKDIKLTYGNKGGMDGIIGYNVFDGRVVEIDHEKNILIIHPRSPEIPKGYFKLPMTWHGDLAFFPATLVSNGKRYVEWLSFDTGGSGALFINSGTMTKNNLYGSMKKIGNDDLKGAGTNLIKTETSLVPELIIGDIHLKEVTADIEMPAKEANLQWPIAGNDLLKRFNVIIDYQNDCFYFRPNKMINEAYQHTVMRRLKTAGIVTLTTGLAVLLFFVSRARSK